MNLRTTEERIRNSTICEANKNHIFEYENCCFAEGIKIARVSGRKHEKRL